MQFENDPTTSSMSGARCARHPEAPAATICSRCGSYACRKCQRVGMDDREYCFECVTRVEVLASRGDRFVANLVDQLIIFMPWFGAIILSTALSAGTIEQGVESGVIAVVGLLATLVLGVYQLYLVAQTGQSIGKRWRKIRVVRTDGSQVSLGRILLLRNLVPIGIGSLCGLFSLIDAALIFNEDRRCLHDMLADTKVVEVSQDSGEG